MTRFSRLRHPALAFGTALALAGCTAANDTFDWDFRSTGGLNTRDAALAPTANRPQADSRGVISYPGYQVVLAQRGETVASVARRLGVSAADLGKQNAIAPDVPLRQGEVLVLPGRVAEPSAATGAILGGPVQSGPIDVGTIASAAIDRAENARGTAPAGITPGPAPVRGADVQGVEPVRHRVAAGESVYTIARLYGVTARAIADWNGLGSDMRLREGQTLLIPPTTGAPAQAAAAAPDTTSAPGQGSATPQPPSAAKPLPAAEPPAAATARPASPDLGTQRTSNARFAMPADGSVLRAYVKKKNDGIDIGAPAGSPVRAAADGTVAAITRDTDQVPIVVIRHADNMLTVYANLDGITVAKDAAVKRGQTIGKVRAGNPSFVHFEVRQGLESLDPMPFLQ
ncbi:peptidoglycan DD-metalloendopeptidase family protein [Ruixingdingia sedimenti]|uniref:Peptidoglycan DD-metalloendopeptidase family protein n=1 Tax=Ruixingdingia sedimenti TaxID=3073604 RepID=A0ABU1F4Q9_9RHOB|nr:peptidoglycan DD-metalloendopeptidase family protein [Xinfangfangia sp. LG-4]MDR5651858.1 peptidoglycan DD-metalloendopeptidase family protein [Xinfangfangia sp. LG-4]